jgi:D-alanyl-D-alanine carboxypeptidase-like protein
VSARSQNGWSANDRSVIASYQLPGGKVAMRKGDVSVVLIWVAQQFHESVEKLVWPGNWGYAERPIRGSSTTLSNHASGTALDLNAPQHPLAKVGTFSAGQVRAIRQILDFCEGVVRWGGDYSGRRDEMHFEINAGSDAVRRIADKIRAGGTTTAAPTLARKDADVLDNIDISGEGSIRLGLPVGRASAVYARAWVSLLCDGPAGATARVFAQSDGGGLADKELSAVYRDGWSSRAWWEVPDGTSQINVVYRAPDGGVLVLEALPR